MRYYRRGDLDLEPAPEPEARDERIRELVDALPEKEQLAVSLMYFGAGSPTFESVAEEMGESEYKVKGYIGRGLNWIGQALQAEDS